MQTKRHTTISLLVTLLLFFSMMLNGHAASPTHVPELSISVDYAHENTHSWAVLWLDIRQEYHAYAHTPSTVGKPTHLVMTANNEADFAATVFYPEGKRQKDIFSPEVDVHVYEGRVPLFIRLEGVKPGQSLTGTLDLLLCSVKHCLPVRRDVIIRLPVDPLPDVAMQSWAAQWQSAVKGKAREGQPKVQSPAAEPSSSLSADTSEVIMAENGTWVFSPRPLQQKLEVESLGKAILLGMLAGLLLNFMPCVLPVLTLKASAMLVVGDGDRNQRLRAFRQHNMLFAAGIMTQFLVLALVLGTAGFIWGQIFQSMALVTGMLIVVFLLGLSMLGLFTLPVVDLKAGSRSSPRLNAFFTGIVATLLATPCSGPLLGGVLGWAFTQPLVIMVVVFLAVGTGMCAPYIVFALKPDLVTFLPRPGRWMEVLERLVGFFLLGTSLYLLSILPGEHHLPLLAALLVVAMGGWVWGRFGGLDAPPLRRKALGLALAALTTAVVLYASRPPEPNVGWEEFTASSFREALGKEPLLVAFTADWCPNCKFLEQTVLTKERLRTWKQTYGLRLIRVDLTRHDAAAQSLLQALGSSSIPLTAIFPMGLLASAPVVLRDIYSTDTLEAALHKAFPLRR